MQTELEVIIVNLTSAVQNGELTQAQAVELLDNFQDHESESWAERAVQITKPAGVV